jgi:hypothetical protein
MFGRKDVFSREYNSLLPLKTSMSQNFLRHSRQKNLAPWKNADCGQKPIAGAIIGRARDDIWDLRTGCRFALKPSSKPGLCRCHPPLP